MGKKEFAQVLSAAAQFEILVHGAISHAGCMLKRLKELNERGSHGGCLCIAEASNGLPLAIVRLGDPQVEKIPAYIEFCQEKALRLAGHPGHECSAQSRDDENNKYGGAIRAGKLIISFSGLPWELDEILCIATAIALKLITLDDAKRIAALSKNSRFAQLGKAMRRKC